MCLLAVAFHADRRYPLVIAANRDEAYARPSVPAEFWPDAPAIVGGRDLLHGGAWLAMSRSGRWAAVTNLRGADRRPESRSRGSLVAGFVAVSASPRQHLEMLATDVPSFGGFHLLAGDRERLGYLASAGAEVRELAAGVHAFSNALPGVEWAKVREARSCLQDAIAVSNEPGTIVEGMLDYLTTPSQASVARGWTELPGIEREAFVIGPEYGTRASTVIVVDAAGAVTFVERSFGPHGVRAGEVRLDFQLS